MSYQSLVCLPVFLLISLKNVTYSKFMLQKDLMTKSRFHLHFLLHGRRVWSVKPDRRFWTIVAIMVWLPLFFLLFFLLLVLLLVLTILLLFTNAFLVLLLSQEVVHRSQVPFFGHHDCKVATCLLLMLGFQEFITFDKSTMLVLVFCDAK